MLRVVRHPHLEPITSAFQVSTTVAPSITLDIGGDNATAARTAAGAFSLTHRTAFARTPVVIGTIGTDIAAGGYFTSTVGTTSSLIAAGASLDNAGSADDGTADCLVFGWNSDVTDITKLQDVCGRRRAVRVIGCKVTTDTQVATVSVSKGDFTVTWVSTGVYTVTYKRAFAAMPLVFASGIHTSAIRAPKVTSKTKAGCVVTLYDETGTVQDGDFYLLVYGFDMWDVHGRAKAPIENSQRKPRLLAGRITVTGGTPAIAISSNDFSSVTDNGSGDYSPVFRTAFKREPIVICSGANVRATLKSAASTTEFRVITANAAGASTEATSVDFIVLGSDDSTVY